MPKPAAQLSTLLALYTPIVARQFRSARTEVRKHFPRGYELVFENFNILGCGYSHTIRGSGVIVSIVAYPRWVTIFFFHGVHLSDPEALLEGEGARIRSVRLDPFARIRSVGVRKLLRQATVRHSRDFAQAPRLSTVIKSVATKRRARRPAT